MKKTLLGGALALTIATSMVAGTLAIYTHEDDLTKTSSATNAINAKKFYVQASATTPVIDVKLAPSEKSDWNFSITNNKDGYISEVDMDMRVKVAFTNAASSALLPDINVDVVEGDTVIAKGVRSGDGTITLESKGAFTANVSSTKNYALRFYWKDKGTNNDAADTAIGFSAPSNEVLGISVSVSGIQANVNSEI